MTTETRGQNSWVNFGSQNYDEQGKPKNIPPAQRPFAVQKVALLPEVFIRALGGPGSGNFGHAGRPGQVGGAAPGSGGGVASSSGPALEDKPIISPEFRVQIVERRAKEVAEQMGIDPSMIKVVDKEPSAFTVGDKAFKEAGHYDPATGSIEINARNTYSPVMNVTNGVIVHEISHAMLDSAQKVQALEHEEILHLPKDEYDKFFNPATAYLRPEMQQAALARWPASAFFHKYVGDDPYMKTKEDVDRMRGVRKFTELKEADGVSDYSTAYRHPGEIARPGGFERALNETLAETARGVVIGRASSDVIAHASVAQYVWRSAETRDRPIHAPVNCLGMSG